MILSLFDSTVGQKEKLAKIEAELAEKKRKEIEQIKV
jgi:hypothetical protein